MSRTEEELQSQPACWRRAAELAGDVAERCCRRAGDERRRRRLRHVLVHGPGLGGPARRPRPRTHRRLRRRPSSGRPARTPTVLAISRSGTTTEVVGVLGEAPAARGPPCSRRCRSRRRRARARGRRARLRRRGVGRADALRDHGAGAAARVARRGHREGGEPADRGASPPPSRSTPGTSTRSASSGTGWTVGLANEAALKLREAAQFWAESYLAMEYRHGPLSIAAPGRAVWPFGALPPGLAEQIRGTGATLVDDRRSRPAGRARAGPAVRRGRGRGPRPRPRPPAQPHPLRHPA